MSGLPDRTNLLFIIDALEVNNKVVKNAYSLYALVKRLEKKKGLRFGYIKYYEDEDEVGKYNGLLNRDISVLRDAGEVSPRGGEIVMTEFGQGITSYLKGFYSSAYESIKDFIDGEVKESPESFYDRDGMTVRGINTLNGGKVDLSLYKVGFPDGNVVYIIGRWEKEVAEKLTEHFGVSDLEIKLLDEDSYLINDKLMRIY